MDERPRGRTGEPDRMIGAGAAAQDTGGPGHPVAGPRPVRARRRVSGAAVLIVGVLMAGCAQPGTASSAALGTPTPAASVPTRPALESAGTPAPPLVACAGADLVTRTPGTLTIATAPDAGPPWFGGPGPAPGAGLEDSVATSIAAVLGYPSDHVTWSTVNHADAAAGRAVDFDLAIDRFTEPAGGEVAADYSTGYFSITDAVIQRAGTAHITSTAQLASAAVGRVAGVGRQPVDTSGGKAVDLATEDDALAALRADTVQVVVLETPDAIAASRADPTLSVAGQLPTDPSSQPEQFTVLLPRGSALTGCVSTAIDRLRVEGTLEQLAHQWIDPLAPPLP